MAERAVSRMLDDEHRENLAMLGQLERSVLDVRTGGVPDDAFAALARSVARHLTDETERHFRFEEDELFPRLAAAGEGDIVELLVEEHGSIRGTGADLLPLLMSAAGGTLDAAGFAKLRPLALELVERLVAHIQKESMALLPMLDMLVDDATDAALSMAYATP